jgi:hypothetical protein
MDLKFQNDGVLSKIVGTRKTKSQCDLFIDQSKFYSPTDANLAEFTGKLTRLYDENKERFHLMSSIEEVIMQLRALDKLQENIKFSIGGRNSEYIYARVPFYRHNHEKKTITEIIGKTEVYGITLSEFPGNKDLMARAMFHLSIKMRGVIHSNIEYVDNLFEKIFGDVKNNK